MAILQPKPAPGFGSSAAASKKCGSYDLFGNSNYQTTGDLYTASQFGMSGIEHVSLAHRTNSGTYGVAAIPPANSSNSSEAVAPTPQNFTLHFYAANGTEVGNNNNLSAESVRVQIWGV